MKFLETFFKNTNNKKKIESLISLIFILCITLIIINYIWNGRTEENTSYEQKIESKKTISESELTEQDKLMASIENILHTIKGVGKVKVLLNYIETSSIIPLYDETTTTSSTEEEDTSGGTRNVTETESQKNVVFCDSSGKKEPVIQKKQTPTIQGAIITAEGAKTSETKNNIINAVSALTGLTIDRIQVFEMEGVQK